ncbi:hypothetical protein C2E25_17005 [Geothermobacter hydrogeniphilus]|uniref:Sensory transduction regulator n=1 Tax=Geothermobacter hydrogeniphilus TaxID=1969733 RepID=A0A2K2H5G0_9BACT|nr:hypothetical protein [Geothermobacter hydrogeniphilus]PNU18562.1 hypothetical protein C2E25_17005 [Geothermobacter hydrogeniphilus]
MKSAIMVLALVYLLAVSVSAPSLARAADDIPLLFPSQDEKSVELQIADYLESKGMHVTRQVLKKNADDVYLRLNFGMADTDDYNIKIFVDTTPSAHNKKTHVIDERKIQIRAYPKNIRLKGITKVRQFQGFCNAFQRRYWAPQRVYLDRDNDLVLAWDINIPGDTSPVHCEQVRDAIVRLYSAWKDMHDQLKKEGLI